MSSRKRWNFWAKRYDNHWVQLYSLKPTRDEIISELKKIIKPGKDYHILDMGCGTGQLLNNIKDKFKSFNIYLTGVDMSEKMLEIARSKSKDITYHQVSIEEFQDNDQKYDIIICSHSFPYYKDKGLVTSKFSKLLKNNGYLLLAQASINSIYDHIVMFFVKFYTGKASYLSIKKIKRLTSNKFNMLDIKLIKKKFYMPTICLFILKKEEKENHND